MKIIANVLMALLLGILLTGGAWADRPRDSHPQRHQHPHAQSGVRFSVHVGTPWLFPPFPFSPPPPHAYWPRVYVPVAPVVVASPPPPVVYVERERAPQPAVPTLEPGYWYYCDAAGAYYPQVSTCPGDWRKVAPQPAR